MAKIERHPAPEKLLLQVTTEAVSALALAGEDKSGDAASLEAGVDLIAKAWGLPQELADNSHTLIDRQKELVEKASGEAALPDDQILDTYDGPMIAELVWGLFETAIRLDALQDRAAVHQMALLLAEALDFDEWIEQCGPGNGKN